MAPKRGSAKVPKTEDAKIPPAKKSKVAETVDDFQDALDIVINIIARDGPLTKADRNMLSTAAPFALRVGRAARHNYQTEVATSIVGQLSKVVENKKQAITDEEAAAGQIEADRAATSQRQADLAAKEEERHQKTADADANLKAARDGLLVAKTAQQDACKLVHGMQAENENTKTERSQLESFLQETWVQLKEGSIPGRQWRERKKHIDKVVAILTQHGTEASCIMALPVSLNDKPEQRGPIATKCIEHVDAKMSSIVKELSEKIEGHSQNMTEKMKAAEDVSEAVRAAQGMVDAKENEFIAADNALCEAIEAHKAMLRKGKELDTLSEASAKKLLQLKDEFNVVRSASMRLEAIVEHGENGILVGQAVEKNQGEQSSALPVDHIGEQAASEVHRSELVTIEEVEVE